MITLTAIRLQVTIAEREGRPPKAATTGRVVRCPSRTQSTHCWPTAADRRQSGQAGRPQRTQETYVSRPGCRKQVGGLPASPGSGAWLDSWSGAVTRDPCQLAAGDGDRLEHHVSDWADGSPSSGIGDRGHNLLSAHHLAEDGVLVV